MNTEITARLWMIIVLIGVLRVEASAQWTQTNGPVNGHKTGCLAVSGTNLYAGTDSGGVFLSTNTGTSWSPCNTGLTERYVWALTFADSNLFAGTSGGVFLSTNGGSNWSPATSGLRGGVSAFAVSGTNLFAGTEGGGVYLSTNNGTSWKSVKTGLTTISVRALVLSNANLFAGTLGGGVFLSTNGGSAWSPVNTNLGNASVYALALSGTNLFAGTGDGVFLSTDNGTTWTPTGAGLENEGSVYALAVSGSSLFAGTWAGNVFLSTNNGSSWTIVSTGLVSPGPIRSFAIAGTDLYAGANNNGVWRRTLSEMVTTAVHMPDGDVPLAFALGQNYPNPFNPVTRIQYTVGGKGVEGRGTRVKLAVYDLPGREVAVLVDEVKAPGSYEVRFSATSRDGSNLASGVYFYRMQVRSLDPAKGGTESCVDTKKLLLVK